MSQNKLYIFDMDETLYPHGHAFYLQLRDIYYSTVAELMNITFDEAEQLADKYLREYGASVKGFNTHHGMNARETLNTIHEKLDLSILKPCAETRAGIEALQGRKVVFTNAPEVKHCDSPGYAHEVLKQLNLHDQFERVFGAIWADYWVKPHLPTYERLLSEMNTEGKHATMIEDRVKNLEPAKKLGMTTVYIHPNPEEVPDYVDAHFTNIKQFLKQAAE